MNTILLGSLPYRDVDRLVAVFSVSPSHRDQLNDASVPDLMAWKQRSAPLRRWVINDAIDFGAEENGVPAERVQSENVMPGLLQAPGRAAADGVPVFRIRR